MKPQKNINPRLRILAVKMRSSDRVRSLLLLMLMLLAFSSSAFALCFAVLGDNRNGDAVFTDIIDRINSDKEIEFAINTGDFTSKGTEREYRHYYDMAKKCRVAFYDTMGNHDIGRADSGVKKFKSKYGNTYHCFDRSGIRFIFLDNSKSKGMGGRQMAWLKNKVKYKGSIFVFLHKPLFDPSGTFPKYIMDNDREKAQLLKLFERSKVKCVFAGHIHGYARGELDGVEEIVTAGAGAPLYLPRFNGGFNHYVKVRADNDNVSYEVVKLYND